MQPGKNEFSNIKRNTNDETASNVTLNRDRREEKALDKCAARGTTDKDWILDSFIAEVLMRS